MKTIEISSYEQQAIDFAKTHKVKLKVLNKDFGFMDWDDKKTGKSRWIFKLRLSRNRKNYTLKFGQSHAKGENEPTIYDVLACLTKYDPESFENFCSEFVYDTDSRKAEKTYLAVKREYKAVKRLFSDVIEELQEIQ